MAHLGESTLYYIMRKSGLKPCECNCDKCKAQCQIPCLGTPEDIERLIQAGYGDRLALTEWVPGVLMGLCKEPIKMIQARLEDNGWCTFYHDGLCELHDKGLKPTEGRLSHHSLELDSFNPKRSLSWLIAKEWLNLTYSHALQPWEYVKTLWIKSKKNYDPDLTATAGAE